MGPQADDRGRFAGRHAGRLAGRGAGVVKVPARIRFPGGHAMTRAARLLVGFAVLLVGTPDLAAQTGGEAASSAPGPIDWPPTDWLGIDSKIQPVCSGMEYTQRQVR